MTRTGRIYASCPAIQNVDKERYRPLLVAARGHVLLKADYRQLQMILLANMSQDPELIKAFREGKDVHWLTVDMCGIKGTTDKEKRDKAKEVNYGILFQITAKGLSEALGTSIATAQEYIDVVDARMEFSNYLKSPGIENRAGSFSVLYTRHRGALGNGGLVASRHLAVTFMKLGFSVGLALPSRLRVMSNAEDSD
jgi:DNA polymerase I